MRKMACRTLVAFLAIIAASYGELGPSSVKAIASGLLIQLDDPDREMQEHAFRVLSTLVELHRHDDNDTVAMIEREIEDALESHRDGSFCRLLLDEIHGNAEREHEN